MPAFSDCRINPASFRDPSGFVFFRGNDIYRQVHYSYKKEYDLFICSGLYNRLVEEEMLIPHEEVEEGIKDEQTAVYKILKPELIPFISYPYEWCFSQLKDAALLTLKIQRLAMQYGMTLKDASSYNIQFRDGRPIFIDTLSFSAYEPNKCWVPYRQFCQHFLAPLSLMKYLDLRFGLMICNNIDGIPLDFTSSILPRFTYLKFGIFMHIHLHAMAQRAVSTERKKRGHNRQIDERSTGSLVESLESTIRHLNLKLKKSEWSDYYEHTNYSSQALEAKEKIVLDYVSKCKPNKIIDFGANDGRFSRVAASAGSYVISTDIDPYAVEKNYRTSIDDKDKSILPLVFDLTNPSPGIGWANKERIPLWERGYFDMSLMLALVHHLAISNNLPFQKIAELLSACCNSLIIEFVPKSDSQVRRLLSTREDIFDSYTINSFEESFSRYFKIVSSAWVPDTERTIYLMINHKI